MAISKNKLALALQGFGAGVQGQGPQFLEAQRLGKQQQEQQLDAERKKAWAVDNRNIGQHLRSGNINRASTLINNRLYEINELGGDPSTTEFLKAAIEAGGTTQALSLIDALDREFVNAGFIQPVEQSKPVALGQNQRLVDPVTRETLIDVVPPEEGGGVGGMASAVTKIMGNGTTIQSMPDGRVVVKTAADEVLRGQAAIDAIRAATEYDREQGAITGAEARASILAIERADEAFESLEKIRTNLGTLEEAKQAVLDGADTGLLASRFPAFSQATVEMRNVQKRLGLNVISSTTFGALSEAELKMALETALPDQLEGPALVDWIDSRQNAQLKLLNEMENLAIFLGTPGNTTADWIEFQKDNQGSQVSPIESGNGDNLPTVSTQEQRDAIPSGQLYMFNGQPFRKR